MNCANHPHREAVAYCQHCGKPVCGDCVRNVGSSVFCEPCLAARVAPAAPPASYGYSSSPGPTGAPCHSSGPAGYPLAGPPYDASRPSPVLAAVLGFIPGVGAMYNGQYAKGIVHLIVFAVLVSLTSNVNEIFLLFVFGWIAYMVIEAYHTACARRDGTALPNPFGLNDLGERLGFGKAWPNSSPNATPTDAAPGPPPAVPVPDARPMYGAGDTYFHQAADGSQTYSAPGAYFHQTADGSQTYAVPGVPPVPPVPPMPPCAEVNAPCSSRFPSGAIWLIVLGLIFLVGNTGAFHILHHRVFWPILLIGFGVWLFVHKMTCNGHGLENDGSAFYQWRFARAVRGAFWVVLVGVIWLLDALGILSWSRSWPLFVIAAGVMLLFKRTLFGGNGYDPGSRTSGPGQPGSSPVAPPAASTEQVSGEPLQDHSGDEPRNDQEGR
jgi:hypothetical protein